MAAVEVPSIELIPSQEETMLREPVARICGDFGPEYTRRKVAAGEPPTELWDALAQRGYLGVNVPEEYDGGWLGMSGLAAVGVADRPPGRARSDWAATARPRRRRCPPPDGVTEKSLPAAPRRAAPPAAGLQPGASAQAPVAYSHACGPAPWQARAVGELLLRRARPPRPASLPLRGAPASVAGDPRPS